MKHVLFGGILMLCLFAALTTPAMAYFVGTPIEVPGDSWTLTGYQWTNSGTLTMDVFQGHILSGSQNFNTPPNPGMTIGSGWTIDYATSTFVQGRAGSPILAGSNLAWQAHFADQPADPLYSIWTSYSSGIWNEAFVLTNDANFAYEGTAVSHIGGNYYGATLSQSQWDPGVVPEPSSIIISLLGLGLASAPIIRRRARK